MVKLLALILVASALAVPASAATRAWVSVDSIHPFVVYGGHFQAGEHVRVVVYAKSMGAKTVTAGARGGFLVRFPGLTTAVPCGAYTVRAAGDRGSRAVLKITPECAPPTVP